MNTYTAEQPDKEQEVIPTVTSIVIPNPEGDDVTSLDHVDTQLNSKSRGTGEFVFLFEATRSDFSSLAVKSYSSFSVKLFHFSALAFEIVWLLLIYRMLIYSTEIYPFKRWKPFLHSLKHWLWRYQMSALHFCQVKLSSSTKNWEMPLFVLCSMNNIAVV